MKFSRQLFLQMKTKNKHFSLSESGSLSRIHTFQRLFNLFSFDTPIRRKINSLVEIFAQFKLDQMTARLTNLSRRQARIEFLCRQSQLRRNNKSRANKMIAQL